MNYNGVNAMPAVVPGPIATEVVATLTSGEHAIPVVSTTPVGTYPSQAPPNSPAPTPQPVYPVSNPNTTWARIPEWVKTGGKLTAFGFAAGLTWTLLHFVLAEKENDRKSANETQTTMQSLVVDSFKTMQKESREDTRELNRSMMATMTEISANLARVARSQERLELKFDKKE